ncbi:ATP-binding cassette domain-containing protein [Dawidia soli]|uniref:ATP-binding cassette domain-containing protein n=1 Tax=Dawidia soli TaxID=2782352 RepID=A0AAP2D9Z9_9BACT|nr:ATP-binding cassette domain-containing protein [Dawidia soli]MBT1687115.1 ATP-binding cassette domain-containing protein [Dawidia soli]
MQASPYCLETTGLTHRYGNSGQTLQHINLQVEPGSIYGFLGPNGAGKTTTLRLVLGLLTLQQGDVSIFGLDLRRHRIEILRRVGALIETPSLYGHLTAHENLEILRTVYRCPRSRLHAVLDLVGLAGTGGKYVSQFSLGMKQRLGIAAALLHSPSLLILDEPTNGLDPHGILEMRALLKRLNEEHGITIVLSSHLLAEIEKLVSHVGVIHRGTLRFQGTLPALHRLADVAGSVTFEVDDVPQATRAFRALGVGSLQAGEKLTVGGLLKQDIPQMAAHLVSQGVGIYSIAAHKRDLETLFMDLISDEQ